MTQKLPQEEKLRRLNFIQENAGYLTKEEMGKALGLKPSYVQRFASNHYISLKMKNRERKPVEKRIYIDSERVLPDPFGKPPHLRGEG